MDIKILKALLSHNVYQENQSSLNPSLFESSAKTLFNCIAEGHQKYCRDLTQDDVEALYLLQYPVATRSEKEEFTDYVCAVVNAPDLQADIIGDLVKELWKRSLGHKIANLGIEISEGSDDAVARLEKILESNRDGLLPDDFGPTTTKDLDTLLELTSDEARWKFNIATLSRYVYGIGPGEFGTIFALPETGKTAFAISLCCAPGGFCEQGAMVLYLGNEEETRRTMLRAMQAWAGKTREEIAKNTDARKEALDKFAQIEEKIEMKDIQEWDLTQVDAYLSVMAPDVVVVDQGDKCQVGGNFSASHERLREVYRSLRELAKKHQCALLTVSQASNEARGRTRLSGFDMEGSRIGKMAENDLVVGVGRHENSEDDEPDNTRYLTVSKNKLSGWHGTVICRIQPEISRYVE